MVQPRKTRSDMTEKLLTAGGVRIKTKIKQQRNITHVSIEISRWCKQRNLIFISNYTDSTSCTRSMGGSRGGARGPDPPGKSQVAVIAFFFEVLVRTPLKKQLDYPIASQRRSICRFMTKNRKNNSTPWGNFLDLRMMSYMTKQNIQTNYIWNFLYKVDHLSRIHCTPWYVQVKRGDRGPGTPLKNHKNKGFLSNTGLNPLENHKATN